MINLTIAYLVMAGGSVALLIRGWSLKIDTYFILPVDGGADRIGRKQIQKRIRITQTALFATCWSWARNLRRNWFRNYRKTNHRKNDNLRVVGDEVGIAEGSVQAFYHLQFELINGNICKGYPYLLTADWSVVLRRKYDMNANNIYCS